MQSELLPSACMVELPSNPQLGRSASVGGFSNALSRRLAAQFRNRLFAVKPDVFEFVFCHSVWRIIGLGSSDARLLVRSGIFARACSRVRVKSRIGQSKVLIG